MTSIDGWEDIDWSEIESRVFQMQLRIFRASQENRIDIVHNLQQLLTRSWSARCLAVRKAAQDSPGRKSPGVDGESALTDPRKLRLATTISLHQRPQPVRRVYIPKPGSPELRPLGIPTIADRTLQHLIVLALEPQWEAKFSPHQYGFRRGYSCHDALIHIRKYIQRGPKWVLDADIEKFFDRLDHNAILKKLSTWPLMETAITRVLKSGVMVDVQLNSTELGTPQGGPLSPLLANIALSGLETDLENAFPVGSQIEGIRLAKPPRLVLYADDFVVLHEHRAVIKTARMYITQWLNPLGLNLSPNKTRICHTLDKVDSQQAGLDFLGTRVQQFRIGKHAPNSAFFNGVWTNIQPKRKAITALLHKCHDTIHTMGPHKKRNAAYQQRVESGKAGPIEVMIIHMNRMLRGWCNYHRHHNAKKTFSRIDHELFWILWRWATRTFPKRGRKRLVQELFNGAHPWRFGIKQGHAGQPVWLMRAAETPILRHFPVQAGRSYYDGDWAYWGKRQGRYPGLPSRIGGLLKRQSGKCAVCHESITPEDRVLTARHQQEGVSAGRNILLHERCAVQLSDHITHRENPFLA